MTTQVAFAGVFDAIYAVDLRYRRECHTLCGDAHCCHFSRYKPRFKGTRQELPLLPGEWHYLSSRRYLDHFRGLRRTTFRVDLACGPVVYDAISVEAHGCPCSQLTRPAVCRLYPLVPVYDPDIGLSKIDDVFALPEIVEAYVQAPRACKLTAVPFAELQKLLAICAAIASEPVLMFYLAAYDLLKAHIRRALDQKGTMLGLSPACRDDCSLQQALTRLQVDLLRGALIDWPQAKRELDELAMRFHARHSSRFDLAGAIAEAA